MLRSLHVCARSVRKCMSTQIKQEKLLGHTNRNYLVAEGICSKSGTGRYLIEISGFPKVW